MVIFTWCNKFVTYKKERLYTLFTLKQIQKLQIINSPLLTLFSFAKFIIVNHVLAEISRNIIAKFAKFHEILLNLSGKILHNFVKYCTAKYIILINFAKLKCHQMQQNKFYKFSMFPKMFATV